MPMMIDEVLDELFGVTPSISKGIHQSIDDLRLGGCCQRIAWSNNGCIAYISRDGFDVNLRHLHCSPKDGQWKLSEEYREIGVLKAHNGHKIIHLSWNHAGRDPPHVDICELAIVDVFGQISIFTIQAPITSRLNLSRRFTSDPEDHLGAVVGLSWLNIDQKPATIYRPAVKEAGQWIHKCSPHKLQGPYNPNQKPALVAVTRGGMIRLVVQEKNLRWQDVMTELDSISSSSGLLSHAAMTADKDDTMLIVTHSIDKHLRLYRVSINFQKLGFSIENLKSVSDCSPLDQNNDGSLMNIEMLCQLSHLAFIPHGPETRNREPTPAFILGAFSYVPEDSQKNSIHQDPLTILARWELQSASPKLHSSFGQLTSKRPNASSVPHDLQSEVSLKRLGDVSINSLLLSIQEAYLSTVLAMTFSDGAVEFRDRTSLGVLPKDDTTKQVSGMFQVGFDFPDIGACLHSALSPNLCAVASISETQEVRLSLMQFPISTNHGAVDDAILEAATEAFTLHFAIASTSNQGNQIDDLLSVIQLFSKHLSNAKVEGGQLGGAIEANFFSEIYRVLDVAIDYTLGAGENIDTLFRYPLAQRCLGMQLSLGYSGEGQQRSISAKVACTMLNLRHASLMLLYTIKFYKQENSDKKKIELIQPILGVIRWSTALMSFITDELFALGNAVKDNGGKADKVLIDSYIRTSNTPAFSLVLISSCRAFLKWICRYLRYWYTETKMVVSSDVLRHALREIDSILVEAKVSYAQFERVLSEIDAIVNAVYAPPKMNEATRKKTEREMLVSATIPDVIVRAMGLFFTNFLDNLRMEIDEAELYFLDTSWLGLSDDKRSEDWRRNNHFDVLKKLVYPKRTVMWRCVRCCAVMEPTQAPQGRACVCNGWWMVIPQVEA